MSDPVVMEGRLRPDGTLRSALLADPDATTEQTRGFFVACLATLVASVSSLSDTPLEEIVRMVGEDVARRKLNVVYDHRKQGSD